jgi:ribosomal-protein-alanine N-acetyltransferase
LRKSCFSRDGYARKYLRINGQWEDHLLFGMLREDYTPSERPELHR